MNKERRNQIEEIKARIAALLAAAEEIKSDLEEIRDDEQDYYDNMPESLQGGDKGQRSEVAIAALEDVISALEDLEGAGMESNLETAAE